MTHENPMETKNIAFYGKLLQHITTPASPAAA